MVLAKGATNAASNRATRAGFDVKMKQKQVRHGSMQLPGEEHTYGRALRPQTPVDVVMANAFGEAASAELQSRYINKVRHVTKCPTKIPLTNAQAHADHAVKSKLMQTGAEPRHLFKLQRFQNVEPRTSTKRGGQAFMSKINGTTATPAGQDAM